MAMYTPFDGTYWYTILLSELEVTVAFVGFSDFWSAGTEEGKSSIGKPRFRSFRLEYRYRPIRLLGQDHAVVTEHRSSDFSAEVRLKCLQVPSLGLAEVDLIDNDGSILPKRSFRGKADRVRPGEHR